MSSRYLESLCVSHNVLYLWLLPSHTQLWGLNIQLSLERLFCYTFLITSCKKGFLFWESVIFTYLLLKITEWYKNGVNFTKLWHTEHTKTTFITTHFAGMEKQTILIREWNRSMRLACEYMNYIETFWTFTWLLIR